MTPTGEKFIFSPREVAWADQEAAERGVTRQSVLQEWARNKCQLVPRPNPGWTGPLEHAPMVVYCVTHDCYGGCQSTRR